MPILAAATPTDTGNEGMTTEQKSEEIEEPVEDDDFEAEDVDLDEVDIDDEVDLDDDVDLEDDVDVIDDFDDDAVVDESDDDDDDDDDDEETAEALDELEAEELELLDEEVDAALLVDEAAELRAIRREELTLNVDAQAPRSDEFTCRSCFLVKRSSQLANRRKMICRDCAE